MSSNQKPAKRKLSKQKIAKQFQETLRANDAARVSARRNLGTVLRFWKVCGTKQCLRARGCTGDCFLRLWPQVPANLQFTILSFTKASAPGRTRRQIEADMERDQQRWQKAEAARADAAEGEARATQSIARRQTQAVAGDAPSDGERNRRLRVL
jgi:hypothetical protein